MKGLLVKDFKLMKCQTSFFVYIIILAAGMSVVIEDTSFIIGYLTFVGSIFTLSTISYDEFDNGNAFLFSLPITRKEYVIEKYGFAVLTGGGLWLISTVIAIIAGAIRNTVPARYTIMVALTILPVLFIILAVMFPLQLKFGGEKLRIVIMILTGAVVVVCFIVSGVIEKLNTSFISIFQNLQKLSTKVIVAIVYCISVLVFFISFKASVSILSKKEF